MENLIQKVKNGEITVSDLVKNKQAYFQEYRSGFLKYQTEDGFEFFIPISDTGEASFGEEHKAIELMRWVRQQVDLIKKS